MSRDAPGLDGALESPHTGLSSWRWNLVAALVFLIAAAAVFGEIWRKNPRSLVPVPKYEAFWQQAARMDVIYGAWLVSRNAYTLVERPQDLFDTEHCAPWENMLTLGTPSITAGLLGVPAWLVTADPILSYNVALLALRLAAALAMFLLITDWTGVPAAGIAAGLLYAFHPVQLGQIHHASVWDSSWTLFALFFARRWFAAGRWRDALGLSCATALQIAACFYPLITAIFVTTPFLFWLLWHYGFRNLRIAQLAVVAASVGLAVAFVYGPYVVMRDGSEILRRAGHFYADQGYFGPAGGLAGSLFVGWLTLGLAAVGLALGRRRSIAALRGDPRWALLLGGLWVWVMASGPLERSLLPFLESHALGALNPYGLLSDHVPGFDSIRGVFRLGAGVQLVLVTFAGLGVAALVRITGRHALMAGAALILLIGFDVVRAPALGFERDYRWRLEAIRPGPEKLAFFETLERMGNSGPLIEVPARDIPFLGAESAFTDVTDRVLLSVYHHRRTSACFGSFTAPAKQEFAAITRRLPEDAAVRELEGLGFTTLVVHHSGKRSPGVERWIAGLAGGATSPLRLLHKAKSMTAFEIVPRP